MKANTRTLAVLLPWIGMVIAIVGMALFGLRWFDARNEAAALRDWQTRILQQISTASGTGEALRPADASDALGTIIAGRDAANAMAAQQVPVTRTTPMDQLASRVAKGTSAGEIYRLRRTQSTGSAAGDAEIIETDSRAAWTGWEK